MIIARLQGGLGNQLFQYAAAKALSHRLNVPFKLDLLTSLNKDRLRKLALGNFNADYQLASNKEIKKFIPLPSLYRHRPSLLSKLGKNIYRELHFHFDESFFALPEEVFLDGFWQSPHYFESISTEIKKDFQVREELIVQLEEKRRELANSDSVAVHIRRGDFLSTKATAFHGVLGKEYYEAALKLVSEKQKGCKYYFFSDDIEWVNKNIDLPIDSTLISKTTKSAIEDFHLMTNCRHNIIANSSFSWWPAWLNANPSKIVIAPKNWFADPSINTADLIPSNWLRI